MTTKCEHSRTELRERTYSNGSKHYVEQCLRCGHALRSYAKDSPESQAARTNGGIPQYDEFLQLIFERSQQQAALEQREAEHTQWLDEYSEYLHSPHWRRLRAAVLKRDNHLCQACLRRRATEVHHLTYEHVGDEFAFELISVCHTCHTRITEGQDHGTGHIDGSTEIPF